MNEPLNYRLNQQTSAVYPGAHPGQMVGAGQLFKRHAPLLASPDPRRIDLRASVLDPFNGYRVRVYQQQSTVNVTLIADLSASMCYDGTFNKRQTLVQLLLALSASARSLGDSFGFIGCADKLHSDWMLPAGHHAGSVALLAKKLQTTRFSGKASALAQAARYLPGNRALVFWASDFHLPFAQVRETLSALQGHDVVPVVLWDAREVDDWPDWRFVTLQDMENGATRTLLMRPQLRQKIQAAYAQRQRDLKNCFRGFGVEPLFLTAGFNATTINRYFQQRIA
ncbi:MAG: MxaS protein [Methylococcaceae bacterium]|nr:MxaS protein [Methylococcaceae bacterium]